MKLAKGGGASSSSETTTKPNCRKWSMTVFAKGSPHVVQVAREGVLERHVAPVAAHDAARAQQLAQQDGARRLDRGRGVVQVVERVERVVDDLDLAGRAGVDGRERARVGLALAGAPRLGGSRRTMRLRRSMPDDIPMRESFFVTATRRKCCDMLAATRDQFAGGATGATASPMALAIAILALSQTPAACWTRFGAVAPRRVTTSPRGRPTARRFSKAVLVGSTSSPVGTEHAQVHADGASGSPK